MPISLFLKSVCFVLHKTFVCVVSWTAVFSAISCTISTELAAEQGTCVAVQKQPVQYTQREEKSIFGLRAARSCLPSRLQGKQFFAGNIEFKLPWISEFPRQFVGFLKLVWGETELWIAPRTSVVMWVALVAFLYSQNKTPKLTVNTWSGTSHGYELLGEQPSHFTLPRTNTGCLLLERFSSYLLNYLFFVVLSYKEKNKLRNCIVKIGLHLDIFRYKFSNISLWHCFYKTKACWNG